MDHSACCEHSDDGCRQVGDTITLEIHVIRWRLERGHYIIGIKIDEESQIIQHSPANSCVSEVPFNNHHQYRQSSCDGQSG